MPMSSHDELLITIIQQTHSIQTALWYVRHYHPRDLLPIGWQNHQVEQLLAGGDLPQDGWMHVGMLTADG